MWLSVSFEFCKILIVYVQVENIVYLQIVTFIITIVIEGEKGLFGRKKKSVALPPEIARIKLIVEKSSNQSQILNALLVLYDEVPSEEDLGLEYYVRHYKIVNEFYKIYENQNYFAIVAILQDALGKELFVQFLGFDGQKIREEKLYKRKLNPIIQEVYANTKACF